MAQKNITHVLYVIENTDLSSMPKIVIFHVLYAISVSLTVGGVDAVRGPHVSVGEGKNPLLPRLLRSSSPSDSPRPTPPLATAGAPPGELRLGWRGYGRRRLLVPPFPLRLSRFQLLLIARRGRRPLGRVLMLVGARRPLRLF
jgi:hypothetical protein